MSTSTTKASAESAVTDRIKKFRNSGRPVITAITIVVLLLGFTFWPTGPVQQFVQYLRRGEQSQGQQQSPKKKDTSESTQPKEEEVKLTIPPIPPGGKFDFHVPPDSHADVTGSNFRVYNVYKDGHECAFGEPCVDGPLEKAYVLNTDKKNQNNTVSYVLKKK